MKRFFKILGWIGAATLLIVLLGLVALQFSFVQNAIAQRVVTYLSGQLSTTVRVDDIRIRLPRSVRLDGLYIEDQTQDTLWYSDRIFVDIDMLGLLRRRVNVRSLLLEEVTATLYRSEADESFNFDFIPAAFSSQDEDRQEDIDADDTSPSAWRISVGSVDLRNINLRYHDGVTGHSATVALGTLSVEGTEADLERSRYSIVRFAIDSTSLVYSSRNDSGDKPQNGGINFDDLHITDFTFVSEHIGFAGETGGAEIVSLGFREKSGFILENLSTGLLIEETTARIEDLNIRTGGSEISGSFSALFPSLEAVRESPEQVRIEVSLDNASIGFSDLTLLQPGLGGQLRLEKPYALRLNASVSGRIDELTIGSFEASIADETRMKVSGRIRGLPDVENALFDLTLEEVRTGHDDIAALIVPDMLPGNIVIPDSVDISGRYRGSVDTFETVIEVRTTIGRLSAELSMNRGESEERYGGTLTVTDFDLGTLLDQPEQFGAISLAASVDGRGLDEERMNVYLDATIDRANIQGYDYRDIRIDGRFRNRQFTGFAGMDDPNLSFRFNGNVHLTDEQPVFAFDFELGRADLRALGFTDEEATVSVRMRADFTGASVETIDGTLVVHDLMIVRDHSEHTIDTLVVTAAASAGQSRLDISSDFLSAAYEGTVSLADIASVLTTHIDRYFALHHLDDEENPGEERFTFTATLHKPEILSDDLVPGLHDLSPAHLSLSYTGPGRNLEMDIDVPLIRYESFGIDSLRVRVSSDREQLGYAVGAAHFELPAMKITAPKIEGTIRGNTISTNVALHDDEYRTVFAIGTLLRSLDTVYTIALVPGELILNYESWNVPVDNYIRFGGEHLYVHDLRLERGTGRIAAGSRDDGTIAPPVGIVISDFDISDIPRMVGNDELEVEGVVNGEIVLSEILTEMKLSIDIRLSEFVFGGRTVGEITARLGQTSSGRYEVEVGIDGQDNRVLIAGYVQTGEGANEIDLTADIRNINLASLEGFTMGQLVDLTGSLTGNLAMSGSTTAPDIIGSVAVRDASMTVVSLNSSIRLVDEEIAFDRSGITFKDVTILDARGNRAVIGGNIATDDFTEYRLALGIRTSQFTLLDTERRHNDIFYGRIIIDSDIRIRGDMQEPVITATLSFREGTNLTVVVPEQDPEVIERGGVVEFVRMDEEGQPIRDADDVPDTIRTAMQGIDLTANIEIDPQTGVRVIIDEQAGDYVQIRGGGTLSLGVDPSGLLSIAGRYEVTDGAYQMTFYEVARRRFEVRPGSSIVWSGDPMEADMDMTAMYTVRAPVIDLVADQVGQEARQQYRRALPFQVLLHMRGNLTAPDIGFELDMPEEQRGAFGGVVYSKLQQVNQNETERNKQVFALLVLNRFLQENPFETGEGAGLSATARTSASKLLTQQLNALSGRYIRGVDIQFDVESYEEYTEAGPAGRTELQLQVSRRFLDDRLIVEVGGQFDLEGERARESELSDIAGDVAVEYILTEDGRYRVRGFRKTEYNTLGDGEVIFTGLSLVYAREFNRFMELFRRPQTAGQPSDREAVETERGE
jgi:translocation and assembly module TamB